MSAALQDLIPETVAEAEILLDLPLGSLQSSGHAHPALQGAASPGALSGQKCGGMVEWHIISTEWQAESLAAVEIAKLGFQVFRPKVRIRTAGTRLRPARIEITDAFPGYLFVSWPDAAPWGRLKATEGVNLILRAVGDNDRPATVPEAFMDWIMGECGANGILRDEAPPERLPPIPVNSWVRIARGPMAGRVALCEWSTDQRVALLFEIMGGQTRAKARRDHVEILEVQP